MDKQNIEQLKKLAKVFNTANVITSEDIQEALKGVLEIMNSFKMGNEKLNSETTAIVENLLEKVMTEHEKMKADVNRETSTTKEEVLKNLQSSIEEIKKIQQETISLKPKDGIDGYTPIKGTDYFDGEDGKDGSPDTAEQIAEKLNSLEEVIDQKVIKGLTKQIKDLSSNIAHNAVKTYTGTSEKRVEELTNNKITSFTTDKLTVSATAPSNPQLYDLWYDIS